MSNKKRKSELVYYMNVKKIELNKEDKYQNMTLEFSWSYDNSRLGETIIEKSSIN